MYNLDAEKFWGRVKKAGPDECWLWQGAVQTLGYGTAYTRMPEYKQVKAHRVAWSLVNGDIPSGMFICHHCDVKLFCNPAHLFLGTPADNMADKAAKGRALGFPGERNPQAKLTPDQVLEILDSPETHRSIAERFGVSREMVTRIKAGKAWKHLRRGPGIST